jgi:hypothetical protein
MKTELKIVYDSTNKYPYLVYRDSICEYVCDNEAEALEKYELVKSRLSEPIKKIVKSEIIDNPTIDETKGESNLTN